VARSRSLFVATPPLILPRVKHGAGLLRAHFEQAFQLFQGEKDTSGAFLAWSAAVDTIVFEWNDFTLLDHWIEWLDERLLRDPSFPSPEIEARVASSMTGALLYRQPYHSDIRKWIERSLSLCREIDNTNLQMQAYLYSVNYYAWIGDLANCSTMAEEIRKTAQSMTASPLLVLTWKWIEALIYNRTTGSWEMALKSVSDGLEVAEKNGVHVWDQMLFSQAVYASLNKGDMAMAGEFLKKMEATLEKGRRHSLCQYYYLEAWRHLLVGNPSRAALSAETASRLADETGMYFTKTLCSLLMAQVLYENGEQTKASAQLSSAKERVSQLGSPMLEYMCSIKEAQFALDREPGDAGTEEQGLEALRRSMELGRKHGYLNLFPWWQPSVIGRLCAKALAEGIEADYVQDLIRTHQLFPDEPPFDIEDWPWPVKIYTLGNFELLKDGKPLQFSGKVQKKPLLMLKALIAQGGKDVREDHLADLLWPDADGDQAHSAFTTTLFRLRRLIGSEKAIEVLEGKATLNPRYVWVDAWAFERTFTRAEDLWKNRHPHRHEEEEGQLVDKAMALYKGHFLQVDEKQSWSAFYRERLRNKFFRIMMRHGDNLQEQGQWNKALEYYQRVLDVDELSEETYRRLMVCFQKLGHPSEAISAYRRCRNILASNLGIAPSPQTEAIYRSLLLNRKP
jgi:LuxR family maltose regulon positive regulatory protein